METETPSYAAAVEIRRRLLAGAVQVRRVVDAGCGAGVVSAALAQSGYSVLAIDVSCEMLAIARTRVPGVKRVPGFKFVEGSIQEVEFGPCEAICAVGEILTTATRRPSRSSKRHRGPCLRAAT